MSIKEKNISIGTCVKSIDSYNNILSQNSLKTFDGIRGFPGIGKTWTMDYCAMYAISCGIFSLTKSIMAKRAIQLVGEYWHNCFACQQIEIFCHIGWQKLQLQIALNILWGWILWWLSMYFFVTMFGKFPLSFYQLLT